jgi:hypothetical protein
MLRAAIKNVEVVEPVYTSTINCTKTANSAEVQCQKASLPTLNLLC